ncbi:MAG TPA: hypothetical protein VM865_03455 [Acidobacteriaceae bacterium]|nr:hypothetical protein [Acidobacteriaceae bacterium]
MNRKGWAQMKLLPLLGIFPWECIMCRSRIFYRDDGCRVPSGAFPARM